ncbi:type II CRISPR RNA-guided endonuclease Cas9 [Entomobacter blattae]|uniref:CRISPR-associated endonuclease Cas9 n=1 Tax=Entomobacter blattae TaxID=2762277 RepID=A0A7H1NS48_9PROT|nr:type II CRISPR RNA-guided endonuclease Cas9 [Entomobacter blattae]QNT78608.1 CRISPR-associated endonuclease Cas9 [Entomobacter blattae]
MQILENITLGFDLGTSSIGWAILKTNQDKTVNEILDAGVWLFNAPETDDKERRITNQIRREKRLARRTVRRKRQRMNAIRELLYQAQLISTNSKEIISTLQKQKKTNPWLLRIQGLERQLTHEEFAITLYHISKHRGFKSNRKGGDKANVGEDKKLLGAMEKLENTLEKSFAYTLAHGLVKNPSSSIRLRNIAEEYGKTPKRIWLEDEIHEIFTKQREYQPNLATSELEENYIKIAFSQRELQDSIDLIGACPFEQGEKRASKQSPSFERFRFLQSLAHLKIYSPNQSQKSRKLTSDEIDKLDAQFGVRASFTYKKFREILDMPEEDYFEGISRKNSAGKDEESSDIITKRSASASGTSIFKKILGKLYDTVSVEELDKAASIISFYESASNLEKALESLAVSTEVKGILIQSVRENKFSKFKGAAHISAKACRALIPFLKQGMVYSEACEAAGYDHTAPDMSPLIQLKKETKNLSTSLIRRKISEKLTDKDSHIINSPVACKAVIEGIKQFVAIVNNHSSLNGCLPGKVHVELARQLGKSITERNKLDNAIKDGTARKQKEEEEFLELFPEYTPSKNALLLYALAKEQEFKCLYTGEPINPRLLFDGISYQVDHILPWSRFGDDSYQNLTLCTANANQAKKNNTPYEWMTSGEKNVPDFSYYSARVNLCSQLSRKKKRNYLLKNAQEVEETFRNRNLNDTQWASKVFLQCLDLFYPDENSVKTSRRIYARPGQLTSKIRQAWDAELYKKDEKGRRLTDDRHHAVDAIVVGCISESLLNRFTQENKQATDMGLKRPFKTFFQPFDNFRQQLANSYNKTVVARAEIVKVSGQKHLDTIRAFDKTSGVVFKRLSPTDLLISIKEQSEVLGLEEALKQKIKDPERNKAIIQDLIKWQVDNCPKDNLPKGPNGDPIRKIKVTTKDKIEVIVRSGSAARGDMARVDVYSKASKKGKKQYYIVPIYPHQINEDQPPHKAITAHKPESEWPVMDTSYHFEFSLHRRSYIKVTTSKNEVIEGYYVGIHRLTGSITISDHKSSGSKQTIGSRNLLKIEKYQIDRLGKYHFIKQEKQLWHGKIYTSANQQE